MRATHCLGLGSVAFLAFAAIGCAPSVGGQTNTNQPGRPADPGTIKTLGASSDSTALVRDINGFRAEGFGSQNSPLVVSDVLYTAAMRHAGYLYSVNSSLGSAGGDSGIITGVTDISGLVQETVIPATAILDSSVSGDLPKVFPMYHTSTNLKSRVRAVAGGDDLLGLSEGARNCFEMYVFGNTLYTEARTATNFRGLPWYTNAENLWYHPLWHIALMRNSSKWFGFSTPADAVERYGGNPPYPLLPTAQFKGVALVVEETVPVTVRRFSAWPPHGAKIRPYGFDGAQAIKFDNDLGWLIMDTNNTLSGPPFHIIYDTNDTITVMEIRLKHVGDFESLPTKEDRLAAEDPVDGPMSWPIKPTVTDDGRYEFRNVGSFSVFTNPGLVTNGLDVDQDTQAGTGSFYCHPESPISLFYGQAGAGGDPGTGGGTAGKVISYQGEILTIDNYQDEIVNRPVLATKVYNPKNPLTTAGNGSRGYFLVTSPDGRTTTPRYVSAAVQLERAIPLSVRVKTMVGGFTATTADAFQIPSYREPNLTYNPNQTDTIIGVNKTTTDVPILAIDSTRTILYFETALSLSDEIDGDGVYLANGGKTPATYILKGDELSPYGDRGVPELRNGEVLIIPSDPLPPGQVYRLEVRSFLSDGRYAPLPFDPRPGAVQFPGVETAEGPDGTKYPTGWFKVNFWVSTDGKVSYPNGEKMP